MLLLFLCLLNINSCLAHEENTVKGEPIYIELYKTYTACTFYQLCLLTKPSTFLSCFPAVSLVSTTAFRIFRFETYHPFFLKEHGFSRQAPKWLCDDYCMHSAGPHLLCQWRCKQRLCNHCHHHDAHRCHRAIASFTFVFGSFRGSRLWPSQRRASRNPSPQTQGRRLLRCRLCRLPGIRVLQRRPEHLCFSI